MFACFLYCNHQVHRDTITQQSSGDEKHYCVLFVLLVNVILYTLNAYSGHGSTYENSAICYLLSSDIST
jgi:hypothetical protein